MNKSELVTIVAEKTGQTKKDAARVVDAMLEYITDTLAEGGSVTLKGFGAFGTRRRAARMAINPKTLERVCMEEAVVPFFRPGTYVKDAVK